MLMEEFQQTIENMGAAMGQMGMTVQGCYECLQKIADIPIICDILCDEDRVWVIPKPEEKPIKLVIENEEVMQIDFD